MKIDVLVAEIGSTTTVVNAFNNIFEGCPAYLGQGVAPTSVFQGDVNIGVNDAIENLRQNLKEPNLSWQDFLATSSAAGGLKMSVHGLVYDMTVKAAKEAALGAGGIIKLVTAGLLRKSDIQKINKASPNIILVAGGVDYGERNTALYNFELIAQNFSKIPIIYAGNIENQEEIKILANEYKTKLYIVENVYPKVDTLNVEPTRKIIQKVFEEHITHAPGMTSLRKLVNGHIVPTPGAVMESAKLLYSEIGDLLVLDVGGATTDLHSVTEGSVEIRNITTNPEPIAKRTVEGDLGVFVNAKNIVDTLGIENLEKEFPNAKKLLDTLEPIPCTTQQKRFVETLTKVSVETALNRHAGKLRNIYGPTGKKTIAEGKDLSAVKYVIGTGGALTRLPQRTEILAQSLSSKDAFDMLPKHGAKILIDNLYIMASLGVLSLKYKEQALALLKMSLGQF